MIRQLGIMPQVADKPPLAWITASAGKETKLILVDDVAYFQADSKLHGRDDARRRSAAAHTDSRIARLARSDRFKQIHRSTIVNLKAIASIVRDDSGRGTVKLKTRPETLTVSQPFMTLFRSM